MDTLEKTRSFYLNQQFNEDLVVVQYDIFNLPDPENSVAEMRSEVLIEQLPFVDKPRCFYEVVRVHKSGGFYYLSTLDFEMPAKHWLEAEGDWKDFYRNELEAMLNQHLFGTNTYDLINRWGYLTATFYGSQNRVGHFHTICYREVKLRTICKRMNHNVVSVEKIQWKGKRDNMLGLNATKH